MWERVNADDNENEDLEYQTLHIIIGYLHDKHRAGTGDEPD